MAIKRVLKKLGSWTIKLKADAPPGLVSGLEFLGHVAVIPGRVNPVERGEECLTLARYVGVVRTVEADTAITLSGSGLEFWLGDEDGKGPVIEAPGVTLSGETFAASIRALLPASGAITEGTLTAVAGTYDGSHVYQTSRTAIDYVCSLFDADWRINGDGTLDAGPASALFVTTPRCVIARRDVAGVDMSTRAVPGDLSTSRSAQEYTSRVVVVAEGLATGSADAATVPYKDLHGNTVAITRVVDEQDDTSSSNASARAQMVLNLWNGTRKSVRLSVSEFDIEGDFTAGDVVWVWDPDAGMADTANEVPFRGGLLNPVAVRVLSVTWPVTQGYTVAYRDNDGAWTDLTEWVDWESAAGGEVEVADTLSAALSAGIGSIGTQVSGGGGGAGDTSVPDVPTFGTFTTTSYQPGDGLAQAAVKVTWSQPLNTDASTIVDGDHYEVRYRPTGTSDWQVAHASWDQLSLTVVGLPPSTGYDWQIRAVDYAAPPNYGAWSATTVFTTAQDTTAPATPAPPTVAASLIAVQVTHTLGLAAGGTFNLPLDLDHLEVHLGAAAGFTPSASTLAGKLQATGGMVTGGVAAVGTFPTSSTAAVHVKVIAVDKTGNRSPASSAASATALLVDTAHISDLTASKITSGTMSATYTLSGSIKTGASGARVELDTAGARLYNSAGTLTVDLNTASGDASIAGKFRTGLTGQRIEIDATGNGTIYFIPASGSDFAYINAPSQNSCGVNSGFGSGTTRSRAYVTPAFGELAYIDTAQAQAGGRVTVHSGGATISGALSGSYVSASAAAATVYAASGGNASCQNSSGAYFSANGTGAYVNAPSGGQMLAAVSSGPYVWARAGDMDVQGDTKLWLLGTTVELGTGGGGEHVKSLTIYNNTSTFSANVGIATTPIGTLWRLTSSARYKVEIAPADLPLDAVRALAPVTYYDRSQAEDAGGTDGLSQQLGLIAEQVHAIPTVGRLLVELNDDGEPESINYDRVAVALLPWLRDLEQRVRAIEGGKPLPAPRPLPKRILDLSTAPRRRPVAQPTRPTREAPP